MLFLPECLGFMGDCAEHTLSQADPPISEDMTSKAKRYDDNAPKTARLFREALSDQIRSCATGVPGSALVGDAKDSDWPETSVTSIIDELRYIACESRLWISGGGVHTKAETPTPTTYDGGEEEGRRGKIYNTHVIIDDEGRLRAFYHKIHLFDVDIPGKVCLKESNTTLAGNRLVVCDSPIGRLGLSICYDMRFSEMYVDLVSKMGAQVLLMPSAFTVPTGKAHWHALLRARAIESQCFVLAAAQVGKHNDKRESYGHSVVYDPWGELLADAGGIGSTTSLEEVESPVLVPRIIVSDIDLEAVSLVRERMPLQQHRSISDYVAELL